MEFLGEVVAWFADGEHWWGPAGLMPRTGEHLRLSAVALVVATVLALPAGLVLGHVGRGGVLAVNLANVARAVPSFALLVLALQVFGFGSLPTYVALLALAVPPILTNTYVGVSGVDREIRESAVGMGMTGAEVLWRVELPLGLPLVMAGLRTAAVQVVATATLAAFIGEGGLGRFIVDGRAQRDFVEVFAGAFTVAVLAVLTEAALGAAQRATVPKGLRSVPRGPVDETATTTAY